MLSLKNILTVHMTITGYSTVENPWDYWVDSTNVCLQKLNHANLTNIMAHLCVICAYMKM